MLQKAVLLCLFLFSPFLLMLSAPSAFGQPVVRDRIAQQVDPASTAALPGTVSPLARPSFDTGRAELSARITGMTMYFKPSAEQQAALDTLLKQQQTPGSPLYHQWITPAQYASQFGLSANDFAKIETWLEQQGFSVDHISNSRNAISFSGTVAQVESAFQTQIHHYTIHGVAHTANAAPLSIPSAFAGVILSVRNVSDFRPHPLHRLRRANPQYTMSISGTQYHFLAPGDFATIYDLNPLYNSGYTGSGQTIIIVGQSAIATSDITNFQKAAGLSQKAPTLTLVPSTGSSTPNDKNGDEDESDLDIEWSGAVAQGATINFVYTGSNTNYGAFDAIQYAIDNNLGSIVSSSYGTCEADLSSSDVSTLQSWFAQANAQGQTVVAASGDDGATDCESISNPVTIVNGDEATQGLAVDVPAASPYVTGIGGTEFLADQSAPGTYWNSTNSTSDTSAIQFIPEEVWNDTSTNNGIEAGGGGKSTLFGKPSWQTGAGVPSDGARDVPDLSLNASPNHDGYLFCASGSDADPTSCSKGFLDSNGDPDVAGGTSFGAPTFAAILAILGQKLSSKGLGNVNPEIYSLAASNSSIFHDTTSGSNQVPCGVGSTDCTTSRIGYFAAPGYDLASGWGSIDVTNFVHAFTSATSSMVTTTALTASTAAAVINTAVTLTATVTSDSGTTVPAGAVQFVVDGANAGSAVTLSATGVATYSYTPTTAGSHTIVANFTPSNSAVSTASSGTLNINVSASSSGSKSFTLAATNVSVTRGGSGTSSVTLTPSGGFTGSVALSVSAPSSLTNACFTYANPSVSASGAITNGSVTVNTSESTCAATGNKRIAATASTSAGRSSGMHGVAHAASAVAFASLLLLWIPGLRRRRWATVGTIVLCASFTLALSGCGSSGGNSSSTANTASSNAPAGTYTLTLTGTDTALNLSSSTTLTLTVN